MKLMKQRLVVAAVTEGQVIDCFSHRYGFDLFLAQAIGVQQDIVAQDVDLARNAF